MFWYARCGQGGIRGAGPEGGLGGVVQSGTNPSGWARLGQLVTWPRWCFHEIFLAGGTGVQGGGRMVPFVGVRSWSVGGVRSWSCSLWWLQHCQLSCLHNSARHSTRLVNLCADIPRLCLGCYKFGGFVCLMPSVSEYGGTVGGFFAEDAPTLST